MSLQIEHNNNNNNKQTFQNAKLTLKSRTGAHQQNKTKTANYPSL